MKTVVCQLWIESERGWGERPDGATLHLNNKDRKSFIDTYWSAQPKDTPDEYSRPEGEPFLVEVENSLYNDIQQSKHGIWLWQVDYKKFLSEGRIVKF